MQAATARIRVASARPCKTSSQHHRALHEFRFSCSPDGRSLVLFTSVVPMFRSRYFTGFTLIELLIVVAIIAILAAIAVPNFLEAQVRAKVSRARTDMRSVATALETYRVDWNAYPPMREPGFTGGNPVLAGGELKWWYVPDRLSTPVSYLSTADVRCPFGGDIPQSINFPDNIWRRYGYENIEELVAAATTVPILTGRYVNERALDLAGQWRLQSTGPDNIWNPSVMYDPTNGTVSPGDIIRTQKTGEGNIRVSPRG